MPKSRAAARTRPAILGVVVTPEALKFVGTGTVLAGKANVRRVLLVNGAGDGEARSEANSKCS